MTIQQDGTAALDSFRMLKKAANLTLPPQARQEALLPVARPQAMPTPQVYLWDTLRMLVSGEQSSGRGVSWRVWGSVGEMVPFSAS